jgi:hypothetical protein
LQTRCNDFAYTRLEWGKYANHFQIHLTFEEITYGLAVQPNVRLPTRTGVRKRMGEEIQAVRAIEKTAAFVEEHPGLVARLGEYATVAWSKAGQALGLVSQEEGAAAELAAARKVASTTVTHSGGAGESLLAQAERSLADPLAQTRAIPAADAPSLLSTVGHKVTDVVTSNWGKLGLIGGGSLVLAGCNDDDKNKGSGSGAGKPIPLRGLGLPLPDGSAPTGTPSETSVPVVSSPDGTPTLIGDPSRPADGKYPGGIMPDSDELRRMINTVPGPQGQMAKQAFNLFISNYNSRVNESQIPKQLPLVDVPSGSDAGADFVPKNIDHWQLKHDVDLYSKISTGGLAGRDLRPHTDRGPAGGKLPPMFFALGLDAKNRPIDLLEYYNPGTGTRYREQYQFRYENMPDGGKRVTVYNWMNAAETQDVGPRKVIGGKQNTLEGISQYYFDPTGNCKEALHYDGKMMTPGKPASDWKPLIDIKYQNGQAYVSNRDGVSGDMTQPQAVDDYTLRQKAAYFSMYDLLGPKLQPIPGLDKR